MTERAFSKVHKTEPAAIVFKNGLKLEGPFNQVNHADPFGFSKSSRTAKTQPEPTTYPEASLAARSGKPDRTSGSLPECPFPESPRADGPICPTGVHRPSSAPASGSAHTRL